MSYDYNRYLESVKNKLAARGFEFEHGFPAGEYVIDLFAYKIDHIPLTNKRVACYLKTFDKVTLEDVKKYSNSVTDHAVRYRARYTLMPCYVFPVLASPYFDEETKLWVQKFKGVYTGTFIHPVLIEHNSGMLIQDNEVPRFSGRGWVKWSNKFVSENLSLASD